MRHTSTIVRTALALLLGSLLAVPTAAAAMPARTGRQPVDLGTLGDGYTISEALAVNDHGQVTGYSMLAGLGPEHAFLWEHGRMRDLGTLGGPTSSATDINNHGQVAGVSTTAASETHAFLWAGGRMRDLGTLGGTTSVAQAINDHGRVVGTSTTATGETHVFAWANGRMRDLGLAATAYDLNDHGQVTGGVQLGETFHAYRLRRGRLTDLDATDVPWSEGIAINEAGQVAGNSAPAPAAFNHAFLWSGGRRVDLGTLGGESSSAAGINDHGAVVGQATTAEGAMRAFIWRHGVMTGLGALAAGENGSRANDINNHGWVVGASDAAGGEFHAVLWR